MSGYRKREPPGAIDFHMLIKLRNKFYQVQCDAFSDLVTDVLDIRPKIIRAMSPGKKSQQTKLSDFMDVKPVQGVDIHRQRRNIDCDVSPVDGESMRDVFLDESN